MDPSRIGACTLGLRMLELEHALDELKSLGFVGVDLWQVSPYYNNQGHVASDAPPEERERVKRMVADRGMKLVHLASYPGVKFRKVSDEERRADLVWARETIDLCVDLGIPVMRVSTGRGEDIDELDRLCSALREACEYASDKGVKLGIETHHGNLTVSTDCTRQVFDAVGMDNLGLLYDPGNLAPHGIYKETISAFADRVFHVHFKNIDLDENGAKAVAWADPDKGATDFDWVLKALDDCGYDGPIAVEFEGFKEDVTVEEARAGLKSWLDYLSTR